MLCLVRNPIGRCRFQIRQLDVLLPIGLLCLASVLGSRRMAIEQLGARLGVEELVVVVRIELVPDHFDNILSFLLVRSLGLGSLIWWRVCWLEDLFLSTIVQSRLLIFLKGALEGVSIKLGLHDPTLLRMVRSVVVMRLGEAALVDPRAYSALHREKLLFSLICRGIGSPDVGRHWSRQLVQNGALWVHAISLNSRSELRVFLPWRVCYDFFADLLKDLWLLDVGSFDVAFGLQVQR